MKRFLPVSLATLLVISLIFSGCAAPAPAPSPAPKPTAAPSPTAKPSPAPSPAAGGERVWRLCGGPAGSSRYLALEAVAEGIRKANPNWKVQVIAEPSTIATYGMMQRGEMEMENWDMIRILEAKKGVHSGRAMPSPLNISWLLPDRPYEIVFYYLKSLPINSIAEMVQKKYPIKAATGPAYTGPWNLARIVLQAYGTSFDDMKKWGAQFYYEGSGEVARLFSDRTIEAALFPGTVPLTTLVPVFQKIEMKILVPTEPEIKAKLEKEGLTEGLIRAGAYEFVKQPIPTMSSPYYMLVPSNMDDDSAYKATKAIWENKDYGRSVSPETLVLLTEDYIRLSYKLFGEYLHPGAKKYWMEKGIIK